MGYHPVTPFGRPVESVLQAVTAARPKDTARPYPIDKWQIFRDISGARIALGLSDRDLTVLQALLSFHPEVQLDSASSLIVYPSNLSICERANGMASSTMRRHLAKLVSAGLLVRRDSPNGKRYARRMAGEKIAFGFDLRPLLLRASEFAQLAEEAREQTARIRTLREQASLLRRDIAGLAAAGSAERPELACWDDFAEVARLSNTSLRRKLNEDQLSEIVRFLTSSLHELLGILDSDTRKMDTNDAQNEQHQQRSHKELKDSEQPKKMDGSIDSTSKPTSPENPRDLRSALPPAPPLRLILANCPEISTFSGEAIHDWSGLVRAVERVRPMTGISDSAWVEAKNAMKDDRAAATLCAMLERFDTIRNPGGYLRHLTKRALEGSFSVTKMVMALSGRRASSQL